MKTIKVDLGEQSYPVYIGQGIYTNRDLLEKHILGHQVLIVTQENLAKPYLPGLLSALAKYDTHVHYLPEGEMHKNSEEWLKIIDCLLDHQFERQSTLLALGGGVVGDMTGFAAATYRRGAHFIQMPTSLIAEVDASVGGKTAINHRGAKNQIGVFYQPRCVIADIDFLKTLPEREYLSGLAEILKLSLICDAHFFEWLEVNAGKLKARDPDTLLKAIETSVKIKADIVSQDETDQGLRQLLNLGHTFGHALESAGNFQSILHGEAVAMGMIYACRLSEKLWDFPAEESLRIQNLLKKWHLLALMNQVPKAEEWIELMQQDKKKRKGKLNFILLKKIGYAKIYAEVKDSDLKALFEA